MARPKSEFLKSFGKIMTILKKVVDQVLAQGGGDDQIGRIDEHNSSLPAQIAKLIMGRAQIITEEAVGSGRRIRKCGTQVIAISAGEGHPWFALGDRILISGTHHPKGVVTHIYRSNHTCVQAVFQGSGNDVIIKDAELSDIYRNQQYEPMFEE